MRIIECKDASVLADLNKDVQDLHHEIEPGIFKPYSKEDMKDFFERSLDHNQVKAYVAYDDKPVGYILLSRLDRKESAFMYAFSVIHIEQICIKESHKRLGIGKDLVQVVKDYAKAENISRIEMNYWTQNTPSGKFFRSLGFENYNERLSLTI